MFTSKDSGSGGIAKNIIVLEGASDSHAWLDSIQSFFMMLKVWQIAAGILKNLTNRNNTLKNAWLDSDYQALGVINLYMKEDLQTSMERTYNTVFDSFSYKSLDNLTKLYATTGPTSQYYLFRVIVNWHIGGETHHLR